MMRKHLLVTALALAPALMAGCGNKEDNNSETAINARADSIVGTRLQELNQEAMDDLDKRMAIDVKAKADSIVAARTGKGGLPDTAHAAAQPGISDEEIIRKTQLPNVRDSAR